MSERHDRAKQIAAEFLPPKRCNYPGPVRRVYLIDPNSGVKLYAPVRETLQPKLTRIQKFKQWVKNLGLKQSNG